MISILETIRSILYVHNIFLFALFSGINIYSIYKNKAPKEVKRFLLKFLLLSFILLTIIILQASFNLFIGANAILMIIFTLGYFMVYRHFGKNLPYEILNNMETALLLMFILSTGIVSMFSLTVIVIQGIYSVLILFFIAYEFYYYKSINNINFAILFICFAMINMIGIIDVLHLIPHYVFIAIDLFFVFIWSIVGYIINIRSLQKHLKIKKERKNLSAK